MAEAKQAALNKATQAEEAQIRGAKLALSGIAASEAIEAAKAGLDITGLFDPSPVSDGLSMSLSLGTGDYWGAFWSGVSMVPYAGDAIAKPVKAARATKKAKELAEGLAKNTKILSKAQNAINIKKIDASKQAAEKARKARIVDKKGNCPYGTNVPKRGSWDPNTPGHGVWTSESGHKVPYENGYPQFDKAYKVENGVEVPAMHPDGSVEIPDMVGNRRTDNDMARVAMGEKLGKTRYETPDGYIWHHKEDGTTMQLVRADFHGGVDGANHAGGQAIVTEPGY